VEYQKKLEKSRCWGACLNEKQNDQVQVKTNKDAPI